MNATTVTEFKVRILTESNRTYGNGLCQVPLELEIESDALLSPSELASIRLVDANSHLEIPNVDSSVPVPSGTWGASTAKNKFDFYPPTLATLSVGARNTEYLHYYVQTAGLANLRKSIGARITLTEGGRQFFSDEVSSSEGQVDIIPMAPPSTPPKSAWMEDWESPKKVPVSGAIDATIYYLGVYINGQRTRLVDAVVAPGSHASTFGWLATTSFSGAFCGYTPPPTSDVPTPRFVYSQTEFIGSYRMQVNESPREACASVVLVSDDNLGRYQGTANRDSSVYALRDQYGNTFNVRISISELCDELDFITA